MVCIFLFRACVERGGGVSGRSDIGLHVGSGVFHHLAVVQKTFIYFRVVSKKTWTKLKEDYLIKQKTDLAELKEKLNELEINLETIQIAINQIKSSKNLKIILEVILFYF